MLKYNSTINISSDQILWRGLSGFLWLFIFPEAAWKDVYFQRLAACCCSPTLLGFFSHINNDAKTDTPENAVKNIFCLLYPSPNACRTAIRWAGVKSSIAERESEMARSWEGLITEAIFGLRQLLRIVELHCQKGGSMVVHIKASRIPGTISHHTILLVISCPLKHVLVWEPPLLLLLV